MEKNVNESGSANVSAHTNDEEKEEIQNEIIKKTTPISATKSSPEDVSNQHIPKETIERLLKDIKDIYVSSLEADGIYYKHSDTNILKAYVMIVGQPDTLYFGGYYFFQINIPADYPHSPPVLEYLTNDGITRFHPNFYKSKRVCMSMLNTWRGEQWTSCLTIKSILLTLSSIMDSHPMLHEPGITEKHQDYNNYHTMILYKNIDFSCMRLMDEFMNTTIIPFEMEYKEYFYTFMVERFKKNANGLKKVITNSMKGKNYNRSYSITGLYNMSFYVHFDELLDKLTKMAKKYDVVLQ
jgi:ubiquitin-conjugating enzyme E2 Z